MAQFVSAGRLTRAQLPPVLLSLAAVGLGTTIGLKLLQRSSEVQARRAVLWFLILAAVGHAFRV